MALVSGVGGFRRSVGPDSSRPAGFHQTQLGTSSGTIEDTVWRKREQNCVSEPATSLQMLIDGAVAD
jgi:hypothetical protein